MLYKHYVRLLRTVVALELTTVAFENVISVVAEEAFMDMTSNKDKIH